MLGGILSKKESLDMAFDIVFALLQYHPFASVLSWISSDESEASVEVALFNLPGSICLEFLSGRGILPFSHVKG